MEKKRNHVGKYSMKANKTRYPDVKRGEKQDG